jgi:hypothetical protein
MTVTRPLAALLLFIATATPGCAMLWSFDDLTVGDGGGGDGGGDGGDAADDGDGAACVSAMPPPANSFTILSDPAQTETTSANGYVLHKALNGYPKYGQGDDSSDILYMGGVGVWTFSIPDDAGTAGTISSAALVVSVDGDDNASGLAVGYGFQLWANHCVFSDEGNISHGAPYDSEFTNWIQLSYPAQLTSGATYVVTMANTTPTPDFIAIEWIELRVTAN